MPTWTTLTVRVRTPEDLARYQLHEPVTPQTCSRVLWVAKMVLDGKAWIVLTAPAAAGAQDPIIGQLNKAFCTWPPASLLV